MPPTRIHFNGSINLPDTDAVFRELGSRIGDLATRYPDGETGDRSNWIWFQLQRFWETPGLERVSEADATARYGGLPKVRLASGADPDAVAWPNLGYADAYRASWDRFVALRADGVIPAGTRFQVQYPTPLASINAWIVPEDQDALEASYTRALFADLDRLLDDLPRDQVAVQWDVAVEFGILTGSFPNTASQDFAAIVERLARCVDRVPAPVPVGLHLCYGDYQHQHFVQPESLALQVRVADALAAQARREIAWLSFTVPQDQDAPGYFAPLRDLRVRNGTELYFALVPYHPSTQAPGTTERQIRLIDEALVNHPGNGAVEWGICTECGMGRVDREDVPRLLELHREIVAGVPV